MKGIDLSAPPTLPKHFFVSKGCSGDVYVGSDSEEEKDNSELNNAMIADGDN